jgi:hypothetical protein
LSYLMSMEQFLLPLKMRNHFFQQNNSKSAASDREAVFTPISL